MPTYTAWYFTASDLTSRTFEAETPTQAMEVAHRLIGDADVRCVILDPEDDRMQTTAPEVPSRVESSKAQAQPEPLREPDRGMDFDR